MSLASDQINRMLLLRIFSEATKIIKCWAKRRAIYSFNFGYLNGISIMIMVAKTIHVMHLERTLMLDDAKTLIQLVVERFFSLFEAWPWTSSDVK
jgi:poly(A) polymerase Pap1